MPFHIPAAPLLPLTSFPPLVSRPPPAPFMREEVLVDVWLNMLAVGHTIKITPCCEVSGEGL